MSYKSVQEVHDYFASLMGNAPLSKEATEEHYDFVKNSYIGYTDLGVIETSLLEELVPWALLSEAESVDLIMNSVGLIRGAVLKYTYRACAVVINTLDQTITVSYKDQSVTSYVGYTDIEMILLDHVQKHVDKNTVDRVSGDDTKMDITGMNVFDRILILAFL